MLFKIFLIASFNILISHTESNYCSLPKDIKGIDSTQTECSNIKISSNCSFSCRPGYTEPTATLTCQPNSKKNPTWSNETKCIEQSCLNSNFPTNSSVLKFPVYAKFYLSSIRAEINLAIMFISFDVDKKLPQYSISLIDKLNSIKDIDREEDGFLQHPCKELNNKQTSSSYYTNSGFDRGHLTPFNLMRFAKKAARSSNLLVNIAPQDPYTNRAPWKELEGKVGKFLANYFGVVVTGVCNELNKHEKIDNLNIPACFWKLVCFKEGTKTNVFGFMHENSLVNTSEAKLSRSNEVAKLRTYKFIKDKNGKLNWNGVWKEAEYLVLSKQVSFGKSGFYAELEYPKWSECANAGDFSKEFEKKWAGFEEDGAKSGKTTSKRSTRTYNSGRKRTKVMVDDQEDLERI